MEIATNGGTTVCEVVGNGPPLVLTHGFEGGQSSFARIVPLLRDRFTVVTYEQRDTCGSDFESCDYEVADLADDLAALLTGLGFDRAHILGTSFGGTIAQEMAIRHPTRVNHLVLAATARNYCYSERLSDEARTVVAGTKGSDAAASRRLAEMYFDPEFLRSAPEMLDAALANRPQRTPEQVERRAAALRKFDAAGRLGTVQAPTLVLQGRSDPVILGEESLAMALEIPNASLVILACVGHTWATEVPERGARLLELFLDAD